MAITSYHPDSGWSAPEIKPYGPLSLDPSSSCFQYCGNIFEGLKVRRSTQPPHEEARFTYNMQAYLGPDGKARLFRPEMNVRRLERSMARLALPVRPVQSFVRDLIMFPIAHRRRRGARAHEAFRTDRQTMDPHTVRTQPLSSTDGHRYATRSVHVSSSPPDQ